MSVFKYLDYRDFFDEMILQNSAKRGYLTQLAAAAQCQKSYLTLVKKREVHFTLEHGMGLCQFWQFSDLETDYFLELISYERAGIPALKAKLKSRLDRLRKANEDLSQRYSQRKPQTTEIELAYYANWYMGALHVMVDVPRFRTVDAIAKQLELPAEVVKRALEKLRAMGFVKLEDGLWRQAHGHLHLPRESVATSLNHQNWRMRAIVNSQKEQMACTTQLRKA